MKRFFAVVVFIIGDFLLYTALFLLGGKVRLAGEDIFIGILFAGIGIGAVLGGAALWGWARKLMTFGVSATTVGGIVTLMALSCRLMMASHASFPQMALTRLLIFGLIPLALGVFLIIKQVSLDKAQK